MKKEQPCSMVELHVVRSYLVNLLCTLQMFS